MQIRTALFVLCGAFAPASAPALADVVAADVSISDVPGVPVASTDVFYDRLSPYGTWMDEPTLGNVFIPAQDGYVPYRTGHWAYTDAGFVWVSTEPFAWATSHYGRWGFS